MQDEPQIYSNINVRHASIDWCLCNFDSNARKIRQKNKMRWLESWLGAYFTDKAPCGHHHMGHEVSHVATILWTSPSHTSMSFSGHYNHSNIHICKHTQTGSHTYPHTHKALSQPQHPFRYTHTHRRLERFAKTPVAIDLMSRSPK